MLNQMCHGGGRAAVAPLWLHGLLTCCSRMSFVESFVSLEVYLPRRARAPRRGA